MIFGAANISLEALKIALTFDELSQGSKLISRTLELYLFYVGSSERDDLWNLQ